MPVNVYKRQGKLRLYRALLKRANRFPLRSRREIVTEEVRGAFRHPLNDSLTMKEVDYKLLLGWELAAAIRTYAENMYWFHSRDEVSRRMMHHFLERDRQRIREMERCNAVGNAEIKTPEVTEFKSSMYHVHPDSHGKIGQIPLTHSRDIWRARGQYGSDVGGPRQKFCALRFKALFSQGW
ncbi:putative Complex1_LYR-like protein [Trypanosoma cruzi]|nr:putative Complex1_LYR-like protein [Trypanosoma cruzi]